MQLKKGADSFSCALPQKEARTIVPCSLSTAIEQVEFYFYSTLLCHYQFGAYEWIECCGLENQQKQIADNRGANVVLDVTSDQTRDEKTRTSCFHRYEVGIEISDAASQGIALPVVVWSLDVWIDDRQRKDHDR